MGFNSAFKGLKQFHKGVFTAAAVGWDGRYTQHELRKHGDVFRSLIMK